MIPRFLELAEVVLIHRDQIERYGGAQGIRDMNLLRSALAMPASGAGNQFFHEDLFAMAAAYLFHIVRNHPFVDGNKRVGTVAAFVFLLLNGIDVRVPEQELETMVTAVAAGRYGKSEAAKFLRQYGTS